MMPLANPPVLVAKIHLLERKFTASRSVAKCHLLTLIGREDGLSPNNQLWRNKKNFGHFWTNHPRRGGSSTPLGSLSRIFLSLGEPKSAELASQMKTDFPRSPHRGLRARPHHAECRGRDPND